MNLKDNNKLNKYKGEFDYKAYIKTFRIEPDLVYEVASDLLSIMLYCKARKLRFDPNELINTLINEVGQEGTILIRCFNWNFCKIKEFNIKKTKSSTGSLGNLALERSDFSRTKHPIYSWCVYGKEKENLCKLDYRNSFGEESMFQKLSEIDARLLVLGNLSHSAFTGVHQGEVLGKAPYRYNKRFTGSYIDYNKQETIEDYYMQVRPLNFNVVTTPFETIMQDIFKQKEIRIEKKYDNCLSCNTFLIKEGIDLVRKDIETNFGQNVISIDNHVGFKKIISKLKNEAIY